MATYHKKSDPAFSLSELTSAIAFEEAGASRFTGGAIVKAAGVPDTNLLDFDEMAAGQVPPAPTMVAAGSARPAGTAKFWSGTLLVANVSTAVECWR
jgi:hypothetical protein